ncbi:LAFE_0H12398g1_1 [Lachancea fermentati]|uniref:Chitin biosynthesis protein CHS5 n=1 Tax=Lachancea fermentati TaxID=4955 RepID=A0A1G4MKJ0_LACFM|nr:LAFE_0H12398g1_1 [Lachancea fermentati]
MPVEVSLTVGKLDASLALLTTKDHHVIEFPTMLLPDSVKAGSIVKIQVSEDSEMERKEIEQFQLLQDTILEKYGTHSPEPPILKIVNVTQTSCVLGWEKLELGSAQLKSLVLYKDGVRSLMIPNPFKTTATKISGLSVDNEYTFQLKLSTTSGNLWSEKITLHTHKMTDMSGITACLGSLDRVQKVTKAQIEESLRNIGAKPLQTSVTIDTTHFISNDPDAEDDELKKAQQSNIPIVRPEWVRACELERRIVGVRGFYIDADVSNFESYKFPSKPTQNGSSVTQSQDPVVDAELPETPENQNAVDSSEEPSNLAKEVNGDGKEPTPDTQEESTRLADEGTSEKIVEEEAVDKAEGVDAVKEDSEEVNEETKATIEEETPIETQPEIPNHQDELNEVDEVNEVSDISQPADSQIVEPVQSSEEANTGNQESLKDEQQDIASSSVQEDTNAEITAPPATDENDINAPETAHVHEAVSEAQKAQAAGEFNDEEINAEINNEQLVENELSVPESTAEEANVDVNENRIPEEKPEVSEAPTETEEMAVEDEQIEKQESASEEVLPDGKKEEESVNAVSEEIESKPDAEVVATISNASEEQPTTEASAEVEAVEVSEELPDDNADKSMSPPEVNSTPSSSKNKKKKNKKKKGKK